MAHIMHILYMYVCSPAEFNQQQTILFNSNYRNLVKSHEKKNIFAMKLSANLINFRFCEQQQKIAMMTMWNNLCGGKNELVAMTER